MEEVPQFYEFKSYNGEEFEEEQNELQSLSYQEFEEKKASAYDINQGDYLYLYLVFKNYKRDSLVEIVLNDSQYGDKQIYTSAASVNKIVSVDTHYDEDMRAYMTEVLLRMPKTKEGSKERRVEVDEVVFLREMLGLKGLVDLAHARMSNVTFRVSDTPLPSYDSYFSFSGEYLADENLCQGTIYLDFNNIDNPEIVAGINFQVDSLGSDQYYQIEEVRLVKYKR